MSYTTENRDPFNVIGISVRTRNAGGDAARDIGALWDRFFAEKVGERIPGRVGEDMLTIYTDYESDQDGDYTALVACPVSSLDEVPDGMVGMEVPGGTFAKYVAPGEVPLNIQKVWREVWNEESYTRRYAADFDIYNDRSFDLEEPETEVWVSIGK